MFKQIFIILVVIALALTVTGCCCCSSLGSNGYYSETQDTENSFSTSAPVGITAAPADSTSN